jgi:hypothetical protein
MSVSNEGQQMMFVRSGRLLAMGLMAACLFGSAVSAQAQGDAAVVYRCPGNLYTSTISRTLDGVPVTVIPAPKRSSAPPATGGSSAARPDTRVDPGEQRARDSDARRILEAELQREEQRLAEMQTEYNKGEPERRGDERNYQKYLDRTADLKSSIARKESDIAALKRELSKLP